MTLDRYRTDPAAFIDEYIPLNEKGKPWRLSPHQRRVLALAFRWNAEGRLDGLRLLLWAEMKKSGKTAMAAALGLWWAFTRPYTEVIVIANDLEQSIGRVFKTMVDMLAHNPALKRSAKVLASTITLSNGTTIKAIASDYRGEAGSRHSLVIFDELWGYISESAQRLWEELTPPPTEPEAWVLVVTYAGFAGESVLLERLYQRGLTGERLDDDLEVYRAEGGLVMFWSHTPRQPWQTPKYYAEQRLHLRPNAYKRLHENEFAVGTEAFITGEMWDDCQDRNLRPIIDRPPADVCVGMDAGVKNDNGACVAVCREGDQIIVVQHAIWKPTKADPLDLEMTMEAWLLALHRSGRLRRVYADPYQLHRTIMSLKRRGVRIEEYPQTPANLTAMGQGLYDLIKGRNLRVYPAPDLRAQALNAVALETTRGWRIAKEKSSKKIDAVVALAMACRAAIDTEKAGPLFTFVGPEDIQRARIEAGLVRPTTPTEMGWHMEKCRREDAKRGIVS